MLEKYIIILFLFAFIKVDAQLTIDAGIERTICKDLSTELGGNPTASGGQSYTYSWEPAGSLNNPSVANPIATPAATTTYYLTVNDTGGIPKTDSVKIIISLDSTFAYAGPDITIKQGQRATLQASGGSSYFWFPQQFLRYYDTSSPDAEPLITTTYYVLVTNEYGCQSIDDVTVNVEPGDSLYFYNTFTPNQDGENDTWYIGNLAKYPDNKLKVYSRFGKLVFSASPYKNEWDGKNFADDLPAATYYYVFTPGSNATPITGSVTIVR